MLLEKRGFAHDNDNAAYTVDVERVPYTQQPSSLPMAAAVESARPAGRSSPTHSVQGSTATFGTPGRNGREKPLTRESGADGGDGAGDGAGPSRAAAIPEVNVNGNAPPTPSAARPRPSKTSTAPSEVETGWGANFWVTLMEPQVCALFFFSLYSQSCAESLMLYFSSKDRGAILCMPRYGRG